MERSMGTWERPRFIAAAGLGRRTGRLSARSGQPRERETSKRKSVRGLRADPEKDAPDVTPTWWRLVRRKNQPHQATTPHFTEPHPASRMANPLLEWRPYAATQSGPLLVAVEREPSPNRSVARFDSPAKG